MLNLLFISDSPKIENIKTVLQPVLKVIIDVVADFDHGLKDVFEKRPNTVCIQEQIGGVAGESVARHIQMLLGNSAPTFILLHNGSVKAKAIKGLYEYFIDISQPVDAIAEELKSTLKLLLGDQWDKIYIPPKLSPSDVKSSLSVPEEFRENADKLVDDFLSDLETSGFSGIDETPHSLSPPDKLLEKTKILPDSPDTIVIDTNKSSVESDRAQSFSDDMAELLLIEANKRVPGGNLLGAVPVSSVGHQTVLDKKPPTLPIKPSLHDVPLPLEKTETPPDVSQKSKLAVVSQEKDILKASSAPLAGPISRVQITAPPPASEFRVGHNASLAKEHIPEDLLLAFEKNYRSESSFLRRSVLVMLLCIIFAAIGWYIIRQNSLLITSLKQRVMVFSGSKQAQTLPVTAAVQKPALQPPLNPSTLPPLPSFIPKEGHDSSYSTKNPGWERYAGKQAEYRVFTASGRIKALQVLAVNNEVLSDSLILSVLRELVGSSEYRIISRNTKSGVRVENGKIQDKGEVLLYRKNGAVKAIVVSVN